MKLKMVYGQLILTSLMWGGCFLATKTIGQYFDPYFGAFMRYCIAVILLVPYVLKKEGFPRLSLRKWGELTVLAFFGITLYNALFLKALQSIEASRAALIFAINPVFTLIGSTLLVKKQTTKLQVAGIVCSFFGTAVVISRGDMSSIFHQFSTGDLLMLGCPICFSIYSLLGKEVLRDVPPLSSTAILMVLGAIMLGIMAAFSPTHIQTDIPSLTWFALVYLGVFAVLAYLFLTEANLALGPPRCAVFLNLVPVFAIILSVIVLGEPMNPSTIYGGFLVVGGVLMTNIN